MAADEATRDPDPTSGEIPSAVEEEEEKESPNEDRKGSMLPRFIYDTSSVADRLMQRAEDAAASSSTKDGETSEGIHPNNTKAKDSDHKESNPK
ncbi:hypothetical protein MRS44_010554 [Fusarium solani]|nr:hypothetical protein MRS44_010554 [Fusarium solani]